MGRGALLCREGGSGMYPLVEESDATVELIDSLPSLLDPSSSLHPALLRRLERSFFLFDISLRFRTTKLQWGGSRDKVRSIFCPQSSTRSSPRPFPSLSASSTTVPISTQTLTSLLLQVALGSSKVGSVLWNEKKKRFQWVGEVENLSKQATER